MEVIFIVTFTVLFFIVSWVIYKLADGDMGRILRWMNRIYFVLIPIIVFMFVFDAVNSGEWSDAKKLFLVMIFSDLFVFSFVQLMFRLLGKRRTRGNAKYGITYYSKDTEFSNTFSQQRLMILFTISIVGMPILNIFGVVEFIKLYIQ